MARTPYADPEAEKAYQSMESGTSKPSYDDGSASNANYSADYKSPIGLNNEYLIPKRKINGR